MSLISNFIKKKLDNYQIQVNEVDESLPIKLSESKSVAIVGSGIAGLTSAILLSERGFNVTLYERDNFLGGKVGSWKVDFENGYTANVEHGFHAFFRQYYNLRNILKKIDVYKHLIPIDDYLIKTKEYGEFSFKDIDSTPILNILSMRKSGVYSLKDAMSNHKFSQMLSLLKYNEKTTFSKFDNISFQEFSDSINLPAEMRLMFTTFSRAFFAEPQYISMAELIKSFHFYFLSNDHGLLYDVLNDDFQSTLLNPSKEFIENNSGRVLINTPVNNISKLNEKFKVNDGEYDYLILGTDIQGTKKIFANSDFLKYGDEKFYNQIMNQKKSQRYAVLRLWMDKRIGDDLPFFVFTDALEILDSITFYHNMEKESAKWSEENNGGIYELHSYALPDDFDEKKVRDQFLIEMYEYFPELKSAKILHEHIQIKKDFTAFHTGLHKNRPLYLTPIENFYLTGDWIKLPIPAMLMEASASSAYFSVNDILNQEKLKEEKIFSVPLIGILA